MSKFNVSYKNPKLRKLQHLEIYADSRDLATKEAPKEIIRNGKVFFLYGISGQ